MMYYIKSVSPQEYGPNDYWYQVCREDDCIALFKSNLDAEEFCVMMNESVYVIDTTMANKFNRG